MNANHLYQAIERAAALLESHAHTPPEEERIRERYVLKAFAVLTDAKNAAKAHGLVSLSPLEPGEAKLIGERPWAEAKKKR